MSESLVLEVVSPISQSEIVVVIISFVITLWANKDISDLPGHCPVLGPHKAVYWEVAGRWRLAGGGG